MAVTFIYSFITSGGFSSIEIEEGEFPGGTFVFKQAKRDYAASMGLARFVAKELDLKPQEMADVVYTFYLDDPRVIKGGRQQRFAAGILTTHKTEERGRQLLSKNPDIQEFTEAEFKELSAAELWSKIKYEKESLPKTKAAIVQFPFTNGFISALILTWRIIPALRQHVENVSGDSPSVVITTCSVDDQMCTHYAPLSKKGKFLLGQLECKEYAKLLGKSVVFDFSQTSVFLKKVFPFLQYFSSSPKPKSRSEEL